MSDNQLSPATVSRYNALKKIIKDNIGATRELGVALKAIKEEKLYLHEYSSWEEFCRNEYALSARHSDRLIEASETKKALENPNESENSVGPAGPTLTADLNEVQLRELKKVPEEKRMEVLQAAASNGTITAQKIAEAAVQIVQPKAPEPIVDKTGWPIPEGRLGLWARAKEVRELLSQITGLQSRLLKFQDEEDELFSVINFSSACERLQYVHMEIRAADLYAVCATCSGRNYEHCVDCRGRGIVSRYAWDRVPEEVKEIRMKACAGVE